MSQYRPFDRAYCTHDSEIYAMSLFIEEAGANV